jgi:undecaprenyl-diphosphatase
MFEKINQFDQHLSIKMLLPQDQNFLRNVAVFLAHSGDSWFWLAALFVVWLAAKGSWHTHAAFLACSIVIQAILVLAIKFMIKRKRPEGEWGAIYRGMDPHSFPSGHAVRAAMLAVLAWKLGIYPLGLILSIWAPIMSLSRVSMGVHYLSDVIAGWLMGILLAFGMLALQPLLFRLFPFVF